MMLEDYSKVRQSLNSLQRLSEALRYVIVWNGKLSCDAVTWDAVIYTHMWHHAVVLWYVMLWYHDTWHRDAILWRDAVIPWDVTQWWDIVTCAAVIP